ncbi:MAG: hypothetical protein MUP30_13310 [Deltaproteobacteria bacterium]|nr:hypothetical protein [Deltaproteobacteria bacterium]
MQSFHGKPNKAMKISACIILSAVAILSLMGASQDMQDLLKNIRRYGTECTFRARILEKTDDKNGLLVQKAPASTVMEKRIYVLITRDTKIGYRVHGANPTWKALSYDNLREENYILIHGLKMTEKEGDQDSMYVEAKRIEPSE